MTSAAFIEEIGSAEAEARKRRERILQLKRKAQGNVENTNEETTSSEMARNVVAVIQPGNQMVQNKNTVVTSDELDLSSLAPRKIDWDLKRGIAKSLEILQERTNEAIAEIIRERMEIDKIND